ncbi:MAG: M48 family metalloprotease [Candidatus Handelsmanbacteria bacterium]|nr:M48 family metalloprotease [Candidatus Handelsmanbacteria bacterium]
MKVAAFPLVLALSLSDCTAVRQQLGLALISEETELDLGRKLAAQVEKQEKPLADAKVQAYVRQVVAPLAQQSLGDRPGVEYKVTVIDDLKQVNAFAIPGGYVYVYSGLLKAAQNEAELAGVLAHEIGHVVGRHSANHVAAQYGLELLTHLTLGEEAGQLAEMAAGLAGAGALARFSRDDEREADEYGFRYLAACGYDPKALLTFFTKLDQLEKSRPSDLEKLFASHPPTPERIERIEKMIAKAGAAGGKLEKERFLKETASLRR